MTKRSCPFDHHLVRQLKVHVNDYENDEKTLRHIQERTMSKLIDGSKRFYSGKYDLISNLDENSNSNNKQTCRNDSKFMQKCVTNYFLFNGKLRDDKSQRPLLLNSTTGCRCSFCDVNTNFLHRCNKCLESFCSSCCFVDYGLTDDSRTCISCS